MLHVFWLLSLILLMLLLILATDFSLPLGFLLSLPGPLLPTENYMLQRHDLDKLPSWEDLSLLPFPLPAHLSQVVQTSLEESICLELFIKRTCFWIRALGRIGPQCTLQCYSGRKPGHVGHPEGPYSLLACCQWAMTSAMVMLLPLLNEFLRSPSSLHPIAGMLVASWLNSVVCQSVSQTIDWSGNPQWLNIFI